MTILDIAAEAGVSCSDCIQEALYSIGLYHFTLHDRIPKKLRRRFLEAVDEEDYRTHVRNPLDGSLYSPGREFKIT